MIGLEIHFFLVAALDRFYFRVKLLRFYLIKLQDLILIEPYVFIILTIFFIRSDMFKRNENENGSFYKYRDSSTD